MLDLCVCVCVWEGGGSVCSGGATLKSTINKDEQLMTVDSLSLPKCFKYVKDSTSNKKNVNSDFWMMRRNFTVI